MNEGILTEYAYIIHLPFEHVNILQYMCFVCIMPVLYKPMNGIFLHKPYESTRNCTNINKHYCVSTTVSAATDVLPGGAGVFFAVTSSRSECQYPWLHTQEIPKWRRQLRGIPVTTLATVSAETLSCGCRWQLSSPVCWIGCRVEAVPALMFLEWAAWVLPSLHSAVAPHTLQHTSNNTWNIQRMQL